MPELVEQMYCSQQIVIPPKFPYILKRYCKAAIKTQPYDLLRWSFEYFKALAERRPPPVKLRLEYPVYSTEGGLTRGCLKVLANQLAGMTIMPLSVVKTAWQGFCLDPMELRRILCLCEVYLKSENVMFLHFISAAGGLLTKSLTHTMILLCETLTKEPDGGSAAIPVENFLIMYRFLARMDASKDVRYINGYKEGYQPPVEEEAVEEESALDHETSVVSSEEDYWEDLSLGVQKIALIDDHVAMSAKLSVKLTKPLIGKIERSPSAERAGAIERENYLKDRKGKPEQSDEVNKALKELSATKLGIEADTETKTDDVSKKNDKQEESQEKTKDTVTINIVDEEDNPVELTIYGEPFDVPVDDDDDEGVVATKSATSNKSVLDAKSKAMQSTLDAKSKAMQSTLDTKSKAMQSTIEAQIPAEIPEADLTEAEKIKRYVEACYQEREERRQDLIDTFEEIAAFVDRYQTANYDLGMVAGRQMSTTSGEFIVQSIEKEIMDYVDEQIAVLPDPDLKKKKAKPEEVAMVRDILNTFLDENMAIIAPEVEEVEEEEELIPEVVMVYAVPGIGPSVDEEIIKEFEDYALETSRVQAEVFMPRNLRHFMCPPLEKYEEYNYETKKEEVPTGGVITD